MKGPGASHTQAGVPTDTSPAVQALLEDLTAIETVAVSVMDAVASIRGRVRSMTVTDFGEMVDIAEMAKRLGVSVSTLSEAARRDPERVPSHKIGACVRFSPREVLEASRRIAR